MPQPELLLMKALQSVWFTPPLDLKVVRKTTSKTMVGHTDIDPVKFAVVSNVHPVFFSEHAG